MSEIEEKRESGNIGKLKIKITRDMLMTWTEDFVRSFNHKEKNRGDEYYRALPVKSWSKLL